MTMKKNISVIFIASVVVLIGTNCDAEVLKRNGTAGKNLNAHTLVSYGREFNDSLITMIGRVIENYHVCTAWSEWSECGAKSTDFFSTKTRTRRCGGQGERYGHRDEIEAGVCEGSDENTKVSCPVSYHTTAKGFCLKLYMNKKTHSDAEAVCKSDGGFLVHIDSYLKYESVKAMLIDNDMKTDIYIDGKRINSQWKFSYGSTSGYIYKWYPGYPGSQSHYQCLYLSGKRTEANLRFLTYNRECTRGFGYICEIPL
ncbi:uncharacterized protein LOC132721223 [Ruditapes philippinarum]|uniref:uncharacterized protein LOC132721223 n=1 Tax=Ruditapes philippinarum TaxID=129788 RepID=UPI00295AEEFF|nr:uncharacterized protein LOC132721223 [Ruditapes philippinarum]